MNTQIGLSNELFDLFATSEDLLSLLNVTVNDSIDVLDNKLRRVAADSTFLDTNDTSLFPFIDFSWIPNNGTQRNVLTFKGVLEFNIWTSQFSDAEAIFNILMSLMKSKYEGVTMIYSGAQSSGLANVYRWVFRVCFLVKS